MLDGYTDEPACLGVPPYISPYARLAFGALSDAGAEADYATIDQYRLGEVSLEKYRLLAVIRNISVPGKYLRGMPASDRELAKISDSFGGTCVASLGVSRKRLDQSLAGRFDHVCSEDLDATLYDLVSSGSLGDRRRTSVEWERWLLKGAGACAEHPDRGGQLIAEVQMYRGCVRYISGGCSFCVEPLLGEVLFRQPQDILKEMVNLNSVGVRNFRLGAQSCVYCYKSSEAGSSETPTPNADAIEELLRGIRSQVNLDVLHLDNANPAVIAAHPVESRKVTQAIARYCTSGNVLAFGLESADPAVKKENNLNATAGQTLEAVRLVNEVGASRGRTGLPVVLPGINFVCGLRGESKDTYRLNMDFLKSVLSEGLLLRRINIRQVIPSRDDFPGVASRSDFERFKRTVRTEIDAPMLERMVPDGTVLTSVYAEVREGGRTLGRQVGSYPLMVDVPYPVEVGIKMDISVIGRSFRSVTGIMHPTDANNATLGMLEAVPGIGRRRAATIIRNRPFESAEQLWALIDEPKALASAQFHLSVGKVVIHGQ